MISGDGRITCPWHGACFNTDSGDIESMLQFPCPATTEDKNWLADDPDAPALDHLAAFPVSVKNGAAYITGSEAAIKAGKRKPNISCKPVTTAGAEHVVIVGGFVILRQPYFQG